MNKKRPQRRSRYVRDKEAFPSFSLNDRDREIIRLVNSHRFLSTDLIYYLLVSAVLPSIQRNEGRDGKERPQKYGFGKKALYNRLQRLFHAQYLERHHLQDRPIGRGFGSSPSIYGLGIKGAQVLSEELGVPSVVLKKVVDQDKVRTPFLRHALNIASFRAILELACRNASNTASLLYWEQGQKLRDSVYALNEQGMEERFSVYPDAFFGISVAGKGKVNYFLEVDRGTMPIISKARRPDIRKKVLGYYHYRKKEKHTRRYYYRTLPDGSVEGLGVNENPHEKPGNPIKGFRVLFLAPGSVDPTGKATGRIANILSSFPSFGKKIHRSSGLFWFASLDSFDIKRPESIFAPSWVTSKAIDGMVSLIE